MLGWVVAIVFILFVLVTVYACLVAGDDDRGDNNGR